MERENTVGFQVRTLSNMIRRTMDEYSSKKYADELTGVHGWVLGYMYSRERENKSVYQRDMERDFGVRRSTVTKLVQLMEKNGLIERVGVKDDARLKQLKLTPRGRELHLCVINDIEEMERSMCRGIPPEDMQTFFSVITAIRENLRSVGAAEEEARPCIGCKNGAENGKTKSAPSAKNADKGADKGKERSEKADRKAI